MLLDYNEKEKSLLKDIETRFQAPLNNALEEFRDAESTMKKIYKQAKQSKRPLTDYEIGIVEELKATQSNYTKLLEEYENERRVVELKAEAREAKYFSQHTEELTEKLQFEIETQIVSFGILQNYADFGAIYQDNEEMRKRLITTYEKYLDILQKHDTESYQLITDFIDNSIAQKEEITQDYRTKLEELPTGSTQTEGMWEKPYSLMLQNIITNDFNKVARLKSTRGTLETWDEQATYRQGDMTIEIPHYEQLIQNSHIGKNGEISTPTKKLLDIATIIFAHNGHKSRITFSLKQYMELCGLKDEKEARRQVNTALEVLYDISISYDDSKNKTKSRNYSDMRIIDDKGIKNGIVHLNFASKFSEMLTECSVMPYHLAMLQTSKGTQHRNSYYIARKISEHVYMNSGKTNEYKISIRTLLGAAPFLATEEEIQKSDRHFDRRIITPFLSDLEEACVTLGISSEGYELHYAGGEKIPDTKLNKLSYDVFIEAYVWFDRLPEYPSQTQRLEKKKAIADSIATLTETKKKRKRKKRKE